MTAIPALIKREFLEHRGAFLYAPAVLLAALTLFALYGLLTNDREFGIAPDQMHAANEIFQVGVGMIFAAWGAYILVALFFYFADSFSADRRNNALLFWKSMPQSDLKVLGSKALTGLTLFPAIISVFAVATGVISYFVLLLMSARLSFVSAPGAIDALGSLLQMSFAGMVFMFLSILWYAPVFAWVAGLSTLFQRWSIPLALLIPGVVVLFEYLNSVGGTGGGRPIADFLSWRLRGFMEDVNFLQILTTDEGGGPLALIGEMLTRIDYVQMGLGVLFTLGIIYLASEYRRRRIEA